MKISTTWSQRDWNQALEKVWKLSRNFEEILEFGLEHGFITSSDIIHASDIYKDPNKECDDEELKEIIKTSNIYDLMKIIQEEYSLDEILDKLPTNEILENISEHDRLDSLDGSWALSSHDDEVKEQVYHEYVDEWIEELKEQDKDYLNNLYNSSGDEFHQFICDTLGFSYYDQSMVNKLKDKLNKNSFGIIY